ncbi:MAG TPA: hypothetical protein VGR21_03790, partial [Cryptosporangiaceae bacterium]|nr:hypothetical protein [Cryptosporangiaceae bacterium]
TLPPSADTEPVTPAGTVAQVGTPTAAAYQRAATLLDNVPAELLDRVRRPDSVVPVLLGLLLSSQPDVRARQQAALTSCYGTAVAEAAAGEADKLTHLHPLLRLPVVELAAPVLRGLPQPERDSVMRCVKALIEADGRLSVSEYCLARLLHRELYESAHRAPPWGQRHHGLAASQGAVAVLLATLAGVGHADHRAAVEAFRAGLNRVLPDAELAYRPPGRGVLDLETAWAALDGLGPADKSRLVEAMVTVISHDGVMTLAEFELLRTICAILHCPLPAVVDQPRLPASADPPRTR